MIKYSKEELDLIWSQIQDYYNKYLKSFGVVNVNPGTQEYYVLIYLFIDYPNTKVISKAELQRFVSQYIPTIDLQAQRHIGDNKGWYVNKKPNNRRGYAKLETLELPYPTYLQKQNRRKINDEEYNFNLLKEHYGNRCATCGSIEGEKHLHQKDDITVLQEGHMNPNLPLSMSNIIPQCSVCNQADKDNFIYDVRGRVIGINNIDFILKSSEEIQIKIYNALKNKYEKR